MRRSPSRTRTTFRVTVSALTVTSRAGEPDVIETRELLSQLKDVLDFDAVVKAVNGIQ